MTRINTNVSSLTAQNALARSNVDLQEALTRLSTGLRINTGKDDPAGLIASEILRSDIISVEAAISNSERANQMIATADSALGQVSSLLNDVRGLISEAANDGAMSVEQVAANQLQIDSSLEAINRIAQTTKFQGRGLLDGSLDFITTADTVPSIEDLDISQANLGAAGQVDVSVDISVAATQATILSASGEAQAVGELKFAARTRVSFGVGGDEIDLVATTVGPQFEGVSVSYVDDLTGDAASVDYNQDDKTLVIHYDSTATLVGTVQGVLDALDHFEAETVTDSTGAVGAADATAATASATLIFEAETAGVDFNDVSISVQSQDLGGGVAYQATWYDSSNRLVITLDSNASGARELASVASDLDTALDGTFSVTSSGQGMIYGVSGGDLEDTELKAVGNSGISGYISSGFSAATRATATLSFAAAATLSVTAGGAKEIDVRSTALGAGDDVEISFADDVSQGSENAVYDSDAKTLVIHYDNSNSTVEDVVGAINALDEWTAVDVDSAGATAITVADTQTTGTDTLVIAALNPGADYNHIQVNLETIELSGDPQAFYDATAKELTIQVDPDGSTTLAKLKAAVDALGEFGAAAYNRGSNTAATGRIYGSQVDVEAIANTAATGGNTLLADMVVEISGKTGAEVFNLQAGASVNQVADAINLVSDGTGVSASQSNGLLTITSLEYGSNAFAAVQVNSEGTSGTFKSALTASRTTGTDTEASINGISAVADGNELSLNTATLDLMVEITAGSTTDFEFSITGGGAQFQLGPEVVTNQQARLGIRSVNTARLGGSSGRLYQIASGESASLDNDPNTAATIVDEAITAVTTLRGRLGAFQKTTLDPNIANLGDTLENLTEAESSIRDADFAAESAALTRAQILVQSGISVLSIANSNPQNVLALLR